MPQKNKVRSPVGERVRHIQTTVEAERARLSAEVARAEAVLAGFIREPLSAPDDVIACYIARVIGTASEEVRIELVRRFVAKTQVRDMKHVLRDDRMDEHAQLVVEMFLKCPATNTRRAEDFLEFVGVLLTPLQRSACADYIAGVVQEK